MVDCRYVAIVIGVVVLCFALEVQAQPSPFDAYEGTVDQEDQEPSESASGESQPSADPTPVDESDAEEREESAVDGEPGGTDGGEECDCPDVTIVEASQRDDVSERLEPAFEQWRLNAGVDGIFARIHSQNEIVESGEISDTTLFSRLDGSVGVMVVDGLELGANLGLVGRRINREETEAATELSVVFQPMARYHIAATHRFSTYFQAALGGYFGRNDREIVVDTEQGPQELVENTNVRGVVASGGIGVGYRFTETVQLRFGFDATWMWGRERLPVEELSLNASTTHLGATVGVRYFF